MQLPDLSLLLVMVIFWATYVVLKVFVLKPLGSILEERERTVAGATAALSAALDQEKETLAGIDRRLTEARREALAARQAARADANAKRQAILEDARAKARAAVAEAQAKLDGEIGVARSELEKNARITAAEIASIALGRRIA
jgi:F0F1-type ATP synthase membrane subunit b/b'